MNEWAKIRNYLKEVKDDCIQLRKRKDLTLEGRGMLIQIHAIEELLGERL